MPTAPNIFISSTCYDLRQIRLDLKQFIEKELGYIAYISEDSSFPIDPDKSTVENCRQRVERDADILILVIGGRYGTLDKDSTKSITNLEYLTARAKGIPVYAFIDKKILPLLSVWKNNKEADYSESVDTPLLFDFIDKVRSIDAIWTNEFESAQDIITCLRTQFSHLMSDGLRWRLTLKTNTELPKDLHGKALRIALEKAPLWEFKLFTQILEDAFTANEDIRQAYKMNLIHGSSHYISPDDFIQWANTRMNEVWRFVDTLSTISTAALEEAFGRPGEPGDIQKIIFIAREMGRVHLGMMEWARSIKRTVFDDLYVDVAHEIAGFVDLMIQEIEDYGPRMVRDLEAALNQEHTGELRTVNIKFSFNLPDMKKYHEKMDILKAHLYLYDA